MLGLWYTVMVMGIGVVGMELMIELVEVLGLLDPVKRMGAVVLIEPVLVLVEVVEVMVLIPTKVKVLVLLDPVKKVGTVVEVGVLEVL